MKNLSEVRASLIEAAERHFSAMGFEKTTLDDITGENGKSKTSIYYHFKNKHEIFRSVIEKEFAAVRENLQKVAQAEGQSRAEAMRAYFRARLDSLKEQGAYRRFASSRFAYGDNPVSSTVSEARRSFDDWERRYLEANIETGHRDGSIPQNISAQTFASTLMAVMKALEIQFFSSDGADDVADTYYGMIDLIVR